LPILAPVTEKSPLSPRAMPRVLEMPSPEAFQHFPRFKDSFSGLIDKSICALDASAHLGNVHEAVMKHVVDVVR